MKIHIIKIILLSFVFLHISTVSATTIAPVGEWLFDNAQQLTKSSIGKDLKLTGTHTAVTGPTASDGAVRIGVGSHYKLAHEITANNGTYVNTYSMLFDFKVADLNSWRTFFQANGANSDDAELFIKKTTGILGTQATGYSTKVVTVGTWNRLVVVVNNGSEFSLYLNGEKILTGIQQAVDSRFALRPEILLFGDNDGDDGIIDIARVSLYNVALNQQDVASLGGYQTITPKYAFVTKPYLQNSTPVTTTIMWESNYNTPGTVNYGTSSNYTNSATSSSTITNAGTYIHKAKLQGLQQATNYFYNVTLNDSTCAEQKFKTATLDANANFSVGIWGDSHYLNPFAKMASFLVDSLNVNFCFSSGDLSNKGNTRSDIATVFIPQVLGTIGSKVPFYTSLGNHDVGSQWSGGDLIRQYIDQPYDNNSDPFNFSGSFAYTYGNTVFIAVDWNRMETDLAPNGWVETFLKSPKAAQAKFRFIFIHCAPFYERWQTAENPVVKTNIPLLSQKYGINAVFSGHMHGYERGLLNGVNYITQGGSSYLDVNEAVGTPYSHIIVGTNKSGNPANFNNGLTNHVLTLDVTSETATVKLRYFDSQGKYTGVVETIEMTPRTPDTSTGIELMERNELSISQNDLNGHFSIKSTTNVNIAVYNMNGVQVFEKQDISPNSILNLTWLNKGAYIIKSKNKRSEFSKVFFIG